MADKRNSANWVHCAMLSGKAESRLPASATFSSAGRWPKLEAYVDAILARPSFVTALAARTSANSPDPAYAALILRK